MRIRLLYASFLLFSLSSTAQITLTRDHLPAVGDGVVFQELDSSYLAQLDLSATGGNQVWDFSSPVPADGAPDTLLFVDPVSTGLADPFPDANLAALLRPGEPEGGVLFYQMSADRFAELGFRDSILLSINLEPESRLTLPFGAGSSFEQSLLFYRDAQEFQDTGQTSLQVAVDAWGTIMTPLGTFSTLRVKRERLEEYNAFGLPVEIMTTTWEYWTEEFISPVFTFTRRISRLFGGEEETISGSYLISQDVVVAARRPRAPDRLIRVFPNPLREAFVAEYDAPAGQAIRFVLCDSSGRALWSSSFQEPPPGLVRQTFGLPDLPPGAYLLILQGADRRLLGARRVVAP